MSKHKSSPVALGGASENPSREHSVISRSAATCRSALGEIGFVGLGHMGRPMAANLAAAGRRVIAYVRRPDQFGELEALGLNPTTDIGDLLDCDVVISMLPDDDAVREVVFGDSSDNLDGLAAGLMPGAIHLSMSTISTAAASAMASEHARYGQGYVAAPVFGNPDAAKARQLFIVAAGASADIERCRPVLDSLGQRTFTVGSDPGDANLFKLLGNMMSATALQMLGEVVAVVRKRGLDPQPFIDIMTSAMFGGRAHKIYGDKIAKQIYTPGFVLPLVLKDVRLALAEAEKAGAPMPSVGIVRDRLISGIARGYGDLDWTALGLIAAEEAGLYAVPSVTAG
ncbi:NAD(P)-dependent oxidoreductase [Bradyrhizobium ottawaense]|uniref:3-hydroxyisobutyrate dehydrogenase n=3 Tax=Bradyrhizobium TaxID=374 RepID=A0ABY0Q0A3_9BRAD|nr:MULTISPECIES: NAD(P)-dependent oxidoreductase [Bradyrhizobium]SDJ28906.1 3-hydroxyisobutyrate dehydrogenase [Bradyrhizobium ottawaense]SEC72708.1 3-hydroxyisobutyrate dehydrogenase [Bradyrhizobium lablabi]SHK86011.1 3-hydroxyisobutyrate dehydrogenase [Bradyrhizobium lablabi]